jgi:hypothetical protein
LDVIGLPLLRLRLFGASRRFGTRLCGLFANPQRANPDEFLNLGIAIDLGFWYECGFTGREINRRPAVLRDDKKLVSAIFHGGAGHVCPLLLLPVLLSKSVIAYFVAGSPHDFAQ